MPDETDDLVREQIAYYRAFAPEYDRWYHRPWGELDEVTRRRMDLCEEIAAEFRTEVEGRRVLEIACGTGWWTERLAPAASSMTALDSAPEAIDVARSRTEEGVRYVVTDVFSWEPDGGYDLVVFGFWLSHVPLGWFEEFWGLVGRALAPGGRALFVDKLWDDDVSLRRPRPAFRISDDPKTGTAVRRVEDGREFRIADVYYEPEELEARLRALGWDAEVRARRPFFYVGRAMASG